MIIFQRLPIVFCCLAFLEYHANAQVTVVDSIQTLLVAHPEKDTTRVGLLLLISQNTWSSNPQLNKQSAEEALQISKKISFEIGIAKSYREISRYYWSQTDYGEAINYATLAVKEYEKLHDLEGVSWCYGSIGISYSQAKNYPLSIDYQQKALTLNRKINNTSGVARNLNNLGYVYELQQDFNKCLSFYQQSLAMRKALGVRAEIVMPLSNVGSAYLALGNYTLASSYFADALSIAIEVGNKNMEALTLQNLGEVHYRQGKFQKAIPYLKKSLIIAEDIGDNKRKEETYQILLDVEQSRHNFEGAFRYQKLLQNLRDTLYSQQRNVQLTALGVKFERERREHAVKLLEHEKSIHILWISLLTGGLLLVITVFVLYYFWERYRTSRNLQMLNLQIDLLLAEQSEHGKKLNQFIYESSEGIERESQDQRLLRKAIEIVELHLNDPQFGVEMMAEALGMSRANLHRRLKTVSGFSPGDFIRNVRLKRAATLIKSQVDSISQIALHVGFEDQSYFSKSFKKQFGMTPTQFAQQK